MTSRTTIRNIDPDLLWDAKIHAAETKQRLGDVINEAIQSLIYEHDTDDTAHEGHCDEHPRGDYKSLEVAR